MIYHLNINRRSRAIHCVLDVLTSPDVYHDLVELPTINYPVPNEIRRNKAFFPWFKDCIGAIDGTHIPMHVPEVLHAAYWNRKGDISQNVLAAMTMDMNSSMSCLDGRAARQIVVSMMMHVHLTSTSQRPVIIWPMLDMQTATHSWFLIGACNII